MSQFRKACVLAAAHFALSGLGWPTHSLLAADYGYSPACAAPNGQNCSLPCPPTCSLPAQQQAVQQQAVQQTAPGMYSQPAATGEFEGESAGYGMRGLGLRIPELHLQLPTLQLPSMVKYRRGPHMRIDSATAPFTQGMPAQFGMLPSGQLSTVAGQQSAPVIQQSAPANCVPFIPPAPGCTTATEKLLRDELARKESEIRQMQDRFGQLESAVNRLADSREREVSMPVRRRAAPPTIVEAGYTEDTYEEENQQPVRSVVSTRNNRAATPSTMRPASAPRSSAPTGRSVSQRGSAQDEIGEEFPQPNVGFSQIVNEDEASELDRQGLGIWKGEGQRPAPKRGDGSGKRSSR